jgi:hypothetical protein
MVFVIGEAFVDLSPCETRETAHHYGFDSLTILKQSDHIVDSNPGIPDNRVAAPHARRSNNVTITLWDHGHNCMVRFRV